MMAIVASDIGHWQNAGLLVEQVSLNVSTADFYTGSLAKKVSETFSKGGIDLNKIVLEISEDVYLGRNDRVVAREIEVLRAAGVRVARDDFGTGYASLTHLVNVPVDIIKIDRAFVARLWPDDPSTIIVEGLGSGPINPRANVIQSPFRGGSDDWFVPAERNANGSDRSAFSAATRRAAGR